MHNGTNAAARTASSRQAQLGTAIRRARTPLTQTQLAELMGCLQSSISQWENGHVGLSAEQINQLEAVLDLPAGQLLLEGGYVDPALCPRHDCSSVPTRPPAPWRPAAGTPGAFPERVFAWLDDFRPLVEAICVLRSTAYDEHALHALLNSHPVLALRLGWEFWEAFAPDCTDSSDQVEEVIGHYAYCQCRYALWGEPRQTITPTNVIALRPGG